MTTTLHPLTRRPLFRGELLNREPASFYVWEPLGGGQEVCHRFDDEFLALHCALALGTTVETNEEDTLET